MSPEYMPLDQVEGPLHHQDYAPHLSPVLGVEHDRHVDNPRARRRLGRLLTIVPWIITTSCLVCVVLLTMGPNLHLGGVCTVKSTTYSPVEDIVGFKKVLFTQRKPGSQYGKYEGASPDVDRNWSDLYNYGMSRIPKSMAARLVNRTLPIPGDTDNYIVELGIFHELHCLNMLRQRLWTPTAITDKIDPNDTSQPALAAYHLSHCLDNIRQSLVCTTDTTPLPLRYDPIGRVFQPSFDIIHTCKDFEAIGSWAKSRAVRDFDPTVMVHDKLDSM